MYAFLVIFFSQCIEPFDQFSSQGFESLLVVEGILTDEVKAHKILLSRTSPIDSVAFIPESNASVWIEDGAGMRVDLSEQEPGKYFTTETFAGIIGQDYTLRIETQAGRRYESSAVKLKSTPPIDSIYGAFVPAQTTQPDGVELYVDSHDPGNQTRYYRWEYEETYEILTPLPSIFEWIEGNLVLPRTVNVGNCWLNDTSDVILVKSTVGLGEDRVSRFRVRFFDEFAQEMRTKYSILLKQYAISEEAFIFWNNLRETQTRQGSFFDIQPGIIQGNLRSLSDDNENVIGFFDASQSRTLRKFFTPGDFSNQGYERPRYFANCQILDTVPETRIGEYFMTENNLETREIWDSFGAFGFTDIFYVIVPKVCANCTNFATNERPDFWE